MKETTKTAIEKLNSQISALISRYETVKTENARLKEELDKCRTRILHHEIELSKNNNKKRELEDKINRLQLGGAFVAATGTSNEARQAINKLIREIDKCISLLNE